MGQQPVNPMPEETPKMTPTTKDILLEVRKMVPPMLEKFHKGQMGRVAVIGGSEDYTGAPYFSAMASARLGADMSHVICEPQAGQVIKTYSPNLMVHPLMRQSTHASSSDSASSIAKGIIQKGAKDYISNGEHTFVSDIEGGLKRSGGQGDTLTGSLATFLGWRKAYLDKLWDHDGDLDAAELLALAAFGGSSITREPSRLAFAKKGRSLQASDLTDEVYVAFTNLFEGSGPKL